MKPNKQTKLLGNPKKKQCKNSVNSMARAEEKRQTFGPYTITYRGIDKSSETHHILNCGDFEDSRWILIKAQRYLEGDNLINIYRGPCKYLLSYIYIFLIIQTVY